MKKEKKQFQLTENITMIEVKDESQVPALRKAIREGEELPKDLKVFNKSNRIVDVGLAVIMQLLTGDTSDSGEINYGALGTGSTAITASDTELETEVYRKLKSDASFDGKVDYVDFFYEKADVSGTFTRFGNFIDGGAGADTGILWSHIVVDWTKTSNDGLFVSCKYTISYKS